jgi:hypothetical protein
MRVSVNTAEIDKARSERIDDQTAADREAP